MKILFALVSVLACQFSIGQEIFAIAGLAGSKVEVEDEPFGDFEMKVENGLFFGFTALSPLTEKVSLKSGLLYIQKGFKYNQRFDDFFGEEEYKATVSIGYLAVPLTVTYSPITSFFVEAGTYVGFGVGGTAEYVATFDGETERETNEIVFANIIDQDNANETVLRPIDFGLNFGIGFRKANFLVSTTYQLGLSDITPKIAEEVLNGDDQPGYVKNKSLTFSVGYLLWKKRVETN